MDGKTMAILFMIGIPALGGILGWNLQVRTRKTIMFFVWTLVSVIIFTYTFIFVYTIWSS